MNDTTKTHNAHPLTAVGLLVTLSLLNADKGTSPLSDANSVVRPTS